MNLKKLFVLVMIIGGLLSARPALADDLAFTGSASFTGTTGVARAITDLQISGTTPSTTPVKLRVTSGTLSMSTTTGLTFTGPSTGSTLQFSGTLANINAALATLTYTRVGTGSDTLEASLVNPGEVFFSGTNHLYEYISSTLTWSAAKTAAENLPTRYGASGYLATITSQEENDFVSARLGGAGWMGASDASSEGDWKWVTGPESGTSFWSGAGGGSRVNGNYANWNTGEPNDSGGNEDCAQFLAGGTGKWNDLPCSGTTLSGYVAEFGAPGNMPTVVSKNVTLTTLSGPLAPSGAAIADATTTTLDIEWTSGGGSETNFLIEKSEGNCSGGFTQIASISSATTTYTATGLSPETRYCFRVRATDGSTNSSYSTTASDFTLPNDPLKPTVENATLTSLDVNIPSDGNQESGDEATLYSLQEATRMTFADYPNGSLQEDELFTSFAAWNNSTVTGLSPNTAYSFRTRISNRNSAGGYSSYSPVSDTVYTLASVPAGFSGTALSQAAASFSWTGNGTSYELLNETVGATVSTSGSSATVSGLACGRTYVFKVRALNGDSVPTDYSTGINITTHGCSSGATAGFSSLTHNAVPAGDPVAGNALGGTGTCDSSRLLTQNLKAPSRDGSYSSFTKGIVKEVRILQEHLNRLGFDAGPVDGIIGKSTTAAIKRMQAFLGTRQDGYVGPITRSLINTSCK